MWKVITPTCGYCGTHANDEMAQFCGFCGAGIGLSRRAPLAYLPVCTTCGKLARITTAKFCWNCGFRLVHFYDLVIRRIRSELPHIMIASLWGLLMFLLLVPTVDRVAQFLLSDLVFDHVNATEMAVLYETNQIRNKYGLTPLEWNGALSELADQRSDDLVRRSYFSHDDPITGEDCLLPLVRQRNYAFSLVGENLIRRKLWYRYYTPEDFARVVVQVWFESPGHRQNLLEPSFTHIGIGVDFYSNGDPVVTQVFASKA